MWWTSDGMGRGRLSSNGSELLCNARGVCTLNHLPHHLKGVWGSWGTIGMSKVAAVAVARATFVARILFVWMRLCARVLKKFSVCSSFQCELWNHLGCVWAKLRLPKAQVHCKVAGETREARRERESASYAKVEFRLLNHRLSAAYAPGWLKKRKKKWRKN